MELVDFGFGLATVPDILRLVIIPAFIWIVWQDWKTRRVPNHVWPPFLAVGIVLLVVELWSAWGTLDWPYVAYPAAISLLVVVPAIFFVWAIGAFGGADAKAVITIAVLFPSYPTYYIGTSIYPVVETTIGSFAFTVFANAVVFALIIPVVIAAKNMLNQNTTPVMFLGSPQPTGDVPNQHGKLLEDEDGFTRSGLDLDTLRMYLRWRGVSLDELQRDPCRYRFPETVPENPNPVDDGSLMGPDPASLNTPSPDTTTTEDVTSETESNDRVERTDGGIPTSPANNDDLEAKVTTEGVESESVEPVDAGDDWGAEEFLTDVDYAYGTTPAQLRSGLEVLVEKETVWVSPGTPFMIPIFAGLIAGLLYGNIIFGIVFMLGV